MTDALELLRRDHDEIRQLLDRIAGTADASAARPLAERLISVASGHEAVEEQYFWPLVRRRVLDGARLAGAALGQEQDVKRALGQLEREDLRSAAFAAGLRQLITAARAHLEFEETRVWPNVRLGLSEQELDELGAQLERGKRLAPTRPHPGVAATPEVMKLAAPIAGATDRIRDVLGGRNRSGVRV
jgi:hypothetical protein